MFNGFLATFFSFPCWFPQGNHLWKIERYCRFQKWRKPSKTTSCFCTCLSASPHWVPPPGTASMRRSRILRFEKLTFDEQIENMQPLKWSIAVNSYPTWDFCHCQIPCAHLLSLVTCIHLWINWHLCPCMCAVFISFYSWLLWRVVGNRIYQYLSHIYN